MNADVTLVWLDVHRAILIAAAAVLPMGVLLHLAALAGEWAGDRLGHATATAIRHRRQRHERTRQMQYVTESARLARNVVQPQIPNRPRIGEVSRLRGGTTPRAATRPQAPPRQSPTTGRWDASPFSCPPRGGGHPEPTMDHGRVRPGGGHLGG